MHRGCHSHGIATYVLPAMQPQKDALPQTTCDATPLVISCDVTSRQSFVAACMSACVCWCIDEWEDGPCSRGASRRHQLVTVSAASLDSLCCA